MKKILILSLIFTSVSVSYAVSYYDALKKQTSTTTTAIAKIDTSNINPVYAESVTQLKAAIPVIISSVKILVPELISLGGSAVAGDYGGVLTGTANLAIQSSTRDAIVNLTKVVIETIQTSIKLANADPSTKKTVKDLLAAVAQDKDVTKVISLVGKVPFVGKDLQDQLRKLITLNF